MFSVKSAKGLMKEKVADVKTGFAGKLSGFKPKLKDKISKVCATCGK